MLVGGERGRVSRLTYLETRSLCLVVLTVAVEIQLTSAVDLEAVVSDGGWGERSEQIW